MRQRDLDAIRRRNFVLGLAILAGLAVLLYAVFWRPHPLAHPYRISAVFTSAPGVRGGLTPVRIAGVDVGRVSAVSSYESSRDSKVTMEIEPSALPIHANARLKVRPRLFLEGNAFIELDPGTPAAPEARSGTLIGLRQTAVAVSFPHVLGALTADTRRDLKRTLQALGPALMRRPRAAEDATLPGSARGETAGEALNHVFRDGAPMLPQGAAVAEAATGEHDGDLRRAIDGFGRAAEGLDDAGPQLAGLLAHLRRTSAAFADEAGAVGTTLDELPGTLVSARAALTGLRRALPPSLEVTRAVNAALPAVPAVLRSGQPWLRQAGALLGEDELGGDLASLRPAVRELAGAEKPLTGLLSQLDGLARCSTRVLIPTANARIEDGPRTSGTSSFAEFLSVIAGTAGLSQSFDGNGPLTRGDLGGGTTAITTGRARQLDAPIYGHALFPPLGTRPAASVPAAPHRPSTACASNAAPDLNGSAAAPGPADGSPAGGR